ncbi:MAG: DUF262 domain-containing protein [Erythrobacter sp.]|nr:DUF262 domain-containing protein [Erythrobacter sp.]
MRDQTPKDIVFSSLLNWVREGRFMVPDFQRDFEWKARDIRDLTRSIFLEYYIGSLLIWKGKPENFDKLACEGLHGQSKANPEHIVLDGQQRLTASGYAFLAPDVKLPTRASRALYYIRLDRFMAGEFDEAFDYAFVTPGKGAGVAGAEAHFGNVKRQYENHCFPLAYAADLLAFADWTSGYSAVWEAMEKAAEDDEARAEAAQAHEDAARFRTLATGIISQSKISYIELDRDLELARVCDIFTQINSKGVRLDVFDLLNALLKPKGVQLRTDLWSKAAPQLDFIDSPKLNIYILQVMSILAQTYCSPQYLYHLLPGTTRRTRNPDGSFEEKVLVADDADFRERWDVAVAALKKAIATLSHPHEFGVSSPRYLPYDSILPVFAAALREIDGLPTEQRLAARSRFSLWYWASIFTGQYSASSETTAARDIQSLRKWFSDEDAEPPAVTEFRNRASQLDLANETKKGTAQFRAIFNLAVISGARDFVSGAVPAPAELNDHHIVPKSWGVKNLGSANASIDTILNRTPLTDHTNQHVIGARLPNVYLAKLIADNGREKVEEILQSHFISPAALDVLLRDPFGPDDFDAFIRERQRTIIATIKTKLLDKWADLPPDLRLLNDAVERIELSLRALVVKGLEGDFSRLPDNAREKIEPRVASAIRKLPGGDDGRFASLSGALQFADIAELRAVFENKITGPNFADIFPNKAELGRKFDQLSELRNAIRHSRQVGDVTRHEGQAAIYWFDQALGNQVT